MIDTRIGNRSDVLALIDDLILIAISCVSNCRLDSDRSVDLQEGLEVIKDALQREVI